jgi:hypothetical protein
MNQTHRPGFDSATIALLKRVLAETEELLPLEARSSEVRVTLASGILMAAADGERDPVRLRSAGLRNVDGRITSLGASWID